MWRCKARKAAPHAGCVSGTNGSGYWGRSAENHLPMGLGRADSLRGREAVEDNAQPMGGLAKQGHFKSAQLRSDQQRLHCSDCRHSVPLNKFPVLK